MVDGVADDPATGDVQVVDAVVAVVVGDVRGGQAVVGAGVELDPGVLVVVHQVADDRVARADHVDAVGVAPVLVALRLASLPTTVTPVVRGGQVDAVVAVAVGGVADDRGVGHVAEVDAGGELPAGREAGAGDRVPGDHDVARRADEMPYEVVSVTVKPLIVTYCRLETEKPLVPPITVTLAPSAGCSTIGLPATPELATLTRST